MKTLKGMHLSALSLCAPQQQSGQQALYWLNEKQQQAIQQATGISKRRIAEELPMEILAKGALTKLLEESQTPASQIDFFVLVTQTSPWRIPSLAYRLQNAVGFSKDCVVLEVNWGCTGYVYGLWLVSKLLAGSRPGSQAILLCGDCSTSCLQEKDSSTAPLFSDVFAATLIEHTKDATPWHFDSCSQAKSHHVIQVPAAKNILKSPPTGLSMDGMKVFEFALGVVLPHLQSVLGQGPWRKHEIDLFVLHQANQLINKHLQEALGLPLARCPSSLFWWGNTSSATIPTTLATALSKEAIGTTYKKTLLGGFGTGLACATLLLSLEPLKACCIHEISPEGVLRRNQPRQPNKAYNELQSA